ncbi:MAG: hypothetical protein B1H13_13140 [Desulfobacteraceae bacterium 4484_190.3]|nr:MAG: hypothetical protein B1H13_13140 [Desulfobacteraceae bacterium 4484_190.3]
MISFNSKGFTLIEVLISGLILFSVLSAGTLAYKSSIMVIDKFIAIIKAADALPQIMTAVKDDLAARKLEGNGQQGKNITYRWKAETVESSRNIISSYDEITGGLEYGSFQLSLDRVSLILSYHGAERTVKRLYEYDELVWFKQKFRR